MRREAITQARLGRTPALVPTALMRAPVSVALAAYNGERYIVAQLRSILAQLQADDEVVVVDDASTDRTCALIEQLGDSRIRLLRQATNHGVRTAFERALGAASGNVLFLSDQDDLWLAGKREALVRALADTPGAVLAISDAQVIDANGAVTHGSFMRTRGGFRGGLFDTLVKNRFLGCAMAFRRELLARVLPIPANVPMHDMWIGALAACSGRVVYVDRPLMQYRRHGGNLSPASPARLATMLRWRWSLLANVVQRIAFTPRIAVDRAAPAA